MTQKLEGFDEKKKPLIGFMILDEWADDMSHWDGFIAYPNPQGSNLAWQKTTKMIEYSAFEQSQAEVTRVTNLLSVKAEIIAELEKTLSYLPKVPTQPYEKELAKQLIDKDSEIQRLREALQNECACADNELETVFCDACRALYGETKE